MSSVFPTSLFMLALLLPMTAMAAELRVCADPDNLPFSSRTMTGLDNRIASLLAEALGMTLAPVWWSPRRGLVSEALDGGLCDLVIGVGGMRGVLLTYPPLYRSRYAFVTRSDAAPVESFDDADLPRLRIGLPRDVAGVSSPAAIALSRRGLMPAQNYPRTDAADANPVQQMVADVADGAIDVGIAWGPVAGAFAKGNDKVRVTLVRVERDSETVPFAFDVTMALRMDEGPLRQRIEDAVAGLRPRIDAVLAEFGVPRSDGGRP